MFSKTFVLFLLPLLDTVVAGNLHSSGTKRRPSRRAHNITAATFVQKRGGYKLQDKFQGQSFFQGWNYYSDPDPTHGNVNYLSQSDAVAKNLTYVQSDGTSVLAVDDYTTLGDGQNRNSVRITTQKIYNQGLFIMDVYAMPHGCSVWPAWWTVGANWPNQGEIDIVEGVHENQFNQYTLHTGPGCNLDRTPAVKNAAAAYSSSVLGTTCTSSNGNNNGCAFLDNNQNSYGHNLNLIAGGVFAMLWDDTGIKTYHFPRGSIPQDVNNFKPDPTNWSTPAAFWSSSMCSQEHFKDHSMVIDTTLCGDWAGATFSSAGCPGTCADYIKNPANFKLAKWKINYIATYTQA